MRRFVGMTVGVVLLGFSSAALAQDTNGGSGLGTGTGMSPTSGVPGAVPGGSDLDLPITPPPPPQSALKFPQVPGLDPGDLTVDLPPESPGDMDDPMDEPPPTFYGEEITSEGDTIFYVIDRSGSMGGGSVIIVVNGQIQTGGSDSSRLARAKNELTKSIQGLSKNFKFNVVAYDCSTTMWSQALMEATDANKQSAVAWVEALQATGATGTGPATALALAQKDNMSVVLLTDGAPNCGASGHEGHRQMISSNNTQGATINVFGIAASGSYREFCMNVAADSGGSYFDVP